MKAIRICSGLVISMILWSSSAQAYAQSLEEDLSRLDAVIEMSKSFEDNHFIRVKKIEERLSPALSPAEAYMVYDKLYLAQRIYSFDLAKEALDKKAEIAARLGDRQKISETAVDRAFLYCVAGMYLESQDIDRQIDTSVLSHHKKMDYYNYKQRFLFDYPEYSPNEDAPSTREQVSLYRSKLIEGTSEESFINRLMRVRESLEQNRLEEADSLSSAFLSEMDIHSHDFAELSYYKAIICKNLNRQDEMMHWYACSAIADIRSNTKDNASLQCLAIELLNRQEHIDKAFRYTQYSLNDAVFYNAKLRPWQIAMSLPAIENAYLENNRARQKSAKVFQIFIISFALLMVFAIIWLISLYSKQIKAKEEVRKINVRLQSALQDLSFANAAKEEYLGLFLSMCSTYIDKLKKHMSYAENESELASFYKTFDNAFLQLYPDFVEKFNALLKPEARIELKKEETLNTELRIFALIKLGITQSSHIASLLRYSVNTIYNYRAQIKNAAIAGKEAFEDQVRSI